MHHLLHALRVRELLKQPLVMSQPMIGKLIREMRQLMGLTQKQLAAELGVVYLTINRWENGHVTPSPMAMKLLEQKLNQIDEHSQARLSKYFQSE
jgi:transcriptional regulator with XRE-family HTH domain